MKLLIVLVLVAALAVGGVLLARHDERPEWTTDSPAAAAALEEAIAARQKLYAAEALGHLETALDLDPDFVMPRIELIQLRRFGAVDRERVERLIEELRQVDLDRLNPRERLLVGYYLARIDHDSDRAEALLEGYLAEHPDDPYAVNLECSRHWGSPQTVREAEACYRRLIRLEPNWVEAQNHLGYLAMAKGDFADAEEQFEVYRYLAPDQANPHDSLGELLMSVGRWDEAEAEFRAAIELRPDFCASWLHLADLALLRRDFAAAREALAEAHGTGGCPEAELAAYGCRVRVMEGLTQGWEPAYEAAAGCDELQGPSAVVAMRAAAATGHEEMADELQARYEKYLAETENPEYRSRLDHIVGARLLEEGDPVAAAERLRAADRGLTYFGSAEAIFKLYNRLLLAEALAASGRAAEAAALRAEVEEVNPRFGPVSPPGAAAARAAGAAGAGAGRSREAPSAP